MVGEWHGRLPGCKGAGRTCSIVVRAIPGGVTGNTPDSDSGDSRFEALPGSAAPSSSGLGRRPLTAVTRVRLPLGLPSLVRICGLFFFVSGRLWARCGSEPAATPPKTLRKQRMEPQCAALVATARGKLRDAILEWPSADEIGLRSAPATNESSAFRQHRKPFM